MAGRVVIPQYMPAEDQNGLRLPGAKMYVYVNNTTTLATTYTTNGLTIPNPNPVIANASGVFPQIWAGNDEVFSISVTKADGTPLVTFDGIDVSDNVDTAAAILAENAAISSLAYAGLSEGYRDASAGYAGAAATSAAQALAAAAGMGATPPVAAIGLLNPIANQVPIYTGPTTAALLTVSPYMQGTLGTANLAAFQASLGLGDMASQDNDNVLILGGNINAVLGGGTPMAASVTTLTFPATQIPSANPNTLDDYEEGTFTPAVTAGTTPPTGVTYAARVGVYTKIGRQVCATMKVDMTSKGAGGTGQVQIGGLPFASAGTDVAIVVGASDGTTGVTSGFIVAGVVVNGSSTIGMRQQGPNGSSPLDWINLTNTWSFILTFTYFTA